MARPETLFDMAELAVQDALEVTGTPFTIVTAVGATLTVEQIATKLEQESVRGPTAVIFFGGGDTNGGQGGELKLDAGLSVAVAARGRTIVGASHGEADSSPGVFKLIDFCRATLHSKPITDIQNPLILRSVAPFLLPWRPLTIAAYVLRFESMMIWAESP